MQKYGYIYGLYDPRDNLARYVGQTQNEPLIRLAAHWQKPVSKGMAVWINDLNEHELRPILRVLERPLVSELDQREFHWMAALINHKMPLLNTNVSQSLRKMLQDLPFWDIRTPGNLLVYTPDES